MMNKTTSQDVIKIVWKACDTFRGTMDSSKYKDYILTMLFVKYVSDFYKEKLEELKAKFGDNEDRIQKSLKREKFQLDSTCTFDVIYENRNAEDIGEIINKILMRIEDDNKEKLEGIFRNIDFNSEAELGRTKERNAALKHLIEDFADASLDLRPSMLDGSDVIGDAYEFLIANFASDAGKKGGEFYTPSEVSTLLAKLVGAKDGDRIYDPTCGSGSLLIKAAKEVGTQNFRLYGQERNGQTQALAKMNMFLHEINDAVIEWVEDDNKEKLEGIFRNIDFNSEAELGRTKERNAALKHLIEDFADASLDLRPSMLDGSDVIGDAYEFLIANFASDAGKKGGEFYTPSEVSTLLAKLVGAKDGDRIYDPTCGSGSLLIKAAKEVGTQNFRLYGQERNGQTQALAKMNMFLHEINDAVIEWGDTLRNPLHLESERLMKFDKIVSNPPFSLDKWGAEELKDDTYGRFSMGLPPKSKGDFAFISHILASLNENGTAGIILPHGVLFRAASEGKIRKQIIENNWLDAVVGLPENLFFGTGIPACILIFKKNKVDKNVVFIDASNEFDKGKNQNVLRNEDIEKIFEAYKNRKEVEKYCHIATFDEIKDNDFNLNIPRYIDTFELEEKVDMKSIKEQIYTLENEIVQVKEVMNKYLEELGM